MVNRSRTEANAVRRIAALVAAAALWLTAALAADEAEAALHLEPVASFNQPAYITAPSGDRPGDQVYRLRD
jgi:hypothetical protein